MNARVMRSVIQRISRFVVPFLIMFSVVLVKRRENVVSSDAERLSNVSRIELATRDTIWTGTMIDTLVAYDPFATQPSDGAEGAPPTQSEPQQRPLELPPLRLRGLVGGLAWVAVVDGVPGRNDAVSLMAGDTIAGVRVVRVSATGVLFHFRDTSWTETLKSGWRE